jgi:hypothetical protein
MLLNAILFLPLFLIGPDPLSLFFFPLTFLPCGPAQLGLFPPLPLLPHSLAGLLSFSVFSSRMAQSSGPASFFFPSPPTQLSSLPPAQTAPRSLFPLTPPPSHADRWDPPVGAVFFPEPDSDTSSSPVGTRRRPVPREPRARTPRPSRQPYKFAALCPRVFPKPQPPPSPKTLEARAFSAATASTLRSPSLSPLRCSFAAASHRRSSAVG